MMNPNLELKALLMSMFDGSITECEEASRENMDRAELERFHFRTTRPLDAESIAKSVVSSFHAKHFSAAHVPYSLIVSHVTLARTNFQARVIILSEGGFISVIALRI